MEKHLQSFLRKTREYVTHWSVAGAILATTGIAPDHWLAEVLRELHPRSVAFPHWLEQVDYRLVAVIAGLSIIVSDTLVRHHRHNPPVTGVGTAPEIQGFPPLPDLPSIAVLAFANLSGDPNQEYFSDGIADDIITELSHDQLLFVIARNSSFTYRGRSIDLKQVGRELGVRYVIEGSARREANRVRVNAQLIDAITGNHIWAKRYDRALEQVFEVQGDIAAAVATAIRPAVGDAEQRRVLRKLPGNLSAWEAFQRGVWYLSKNTLDGNEQARELFRQAANFDTGLASAFVGLAASNISDTLFHGLLPLVDASRLVETNARKAIECNPNDSEAHSTLGWAFFFRGNLTGALDCVERALRLNPNSTVGYFLKGSVLIYTGRGAEGRVEVSMSLRLSPRDPTSPYAMGTITASYYLERDYLATVEAARRGLDSYPAYAPSRRWLVAALGQLGRRDEAADALRDSLAVAPAVFDSMVRNRPPWVRIEDHEHLLDGLSRAGWKA